MKKIIITSTLLVLVFTLFQTVKKDDVKSPESCPVTVSYYTNVKTITATACANVTCHSSGTCDKAFDDLAMITENHRVN